MSNMTKLLIGTGFIVALGLISTLFLPRSPEASLQALAEDYVRLALALDEISEGEVDIYYGPDSLRPAGIDSLSGIAERARDLAGEVDNLTDLEDAASALRRDRLLSRLEQLALVAEFLTDPGAMTFAEQTRSVYGLPLEELPEDTRLDDDGRLVIEDLPPTPLEIERDAILERLRELLPGTGSLSFRVASFQAQNLVPVNQREAVFAAALEACREATLEHWSLPANETLAIEWTRDVSSPWHEYLGDGGSRIQINPLTIGYIGTMIDVACHEGYPGHHAQFLLRDGEPGNTTPVEDTLVLLRSPEAVLLEGAAEFAVKLAMPAQRRQEVEREILFPMADLSTDNLETYAEIHSLIGRLGRATIPTIQEFSDGELPETAAVVNLEREALVASPRGLLEFIKQYGAYTVGYTLAQSQVTQYIESRSSETGESPWSILALILTDPELIDPVFAESIDE